MIKKINFQYIISYLGLIPYFIILIDKFFFLLIKKEITLNFALYYTLIICVFIGAINWSFEKKVSNYLLFYGFFPSIFAVIIIILNLYSFNITVIFLFLIIFLIIQLFLDYFIVFVNFLNKKTFYFLRLPLTILISLTLIILQL